MAWPFSSSSSKKKGQDEDDDEKQNNYDGDEEKDSEDVDDNGETSGPRLDQDDEDEGDDIELDNPLNFPIEAQDWSMKHFLTRDYSRLYEFAKDRSAKDIMDMKRKRTWKVHIRNVVFTNDERLRDPFFQYCFGHDHKLYRKQAAIKGQNKQGKAKKDSKGRVIESEGPRWEWVEKGSKGFMRTSEVHSGVDKGDTVTYQDDFNFTWRGSYFDLYTKKLRIELWDYNRFTPNTFIAYADHTLKSIASGSVNQDWLISTEVRRKGKLQRVPVGRIEFQCIFQEVLTYTIKLHDWGADINPWLFVPEIDEAEQEELVPYCVFNLHRQNHFPLFSRKRSSSRAKRYEFTGKDKTIHMDLGLVRHMTFRGTRHELESGNMYVNMYDRNLPFGLDRVPMGQTSIPLTKLSEIGFLKASMRKSGYNASSGKGGFYSGLANIFSPSSSSSKVASGPSQRSGEVYGSVTVDVSDPKRNRLFREYAQMGEPNPPELRDYKPYNSSYLVVKIVKAQNLIAADDTGYSDPYITLEWGGQWAKTKIVYENTNPTFNETLFFHIRCCDPKNITKEELIAMPYVRICCWDHDETGSSDFLGEAKLYLHQLTGCEADPDQPEPDVVPQPKTQSVIVYRSRRRGAKPRPVVIRTRVFQGALKLQGLPLGYDSFVTVEAYFRTPEGDLMMPSPSDKSIRRLMVLPNLKLMEETQQLCFCYPVNTITETVVCPAVEAGLKCETLEQWRRKLGKYPAAMRRTIKFQGETRSQGFFVPNQFGQKHFLPTFVTAMTPPKDYIDVSENPSMAIWSSQKPNSCYKVAQFIRTMEFTNHDNAEDAAVNLSNYTWQSSDFFLSMKKSNLQSHALLLLNMFLGLKTDAYLCVGYVRTPPTRATIIAARAKYEKLPQHVIDEKLAALEGPPKWHVWLMTRESTSNCCGGEFKDVEGEGAVKFWEVSKGAYYLPLPNRWRGQDDESAMARALETQKKTKKNKRAKVVQKSNVVVDQADIVDESQTTYVEMTEDDMLEDELDAGEVSVNLTEVFELGAGMGDDWGRPDQTVLMEAEKQRRRMEAMRKQSRRVNPAEVNSGVHRNGGNEEGMKEVQKNDEYKRRKEFIDGRKKEEKNLREKIPYTSLIAVFNHRNMWINVQDSADPCEIAYDFEDEEASGWLPALPGEYTRKKASKTFICPNSRPRSLGPKATEDIVATLQKEIKFEIESGIDNYRDSSNRRTTFATTDFTDMLHQVIIAKNDLALIDKIESNGWDVVQGEWVKFGKTPSKGYTANWLYCRALEDVIGAVPLGYKYRIKFFKINGCSDTSAVRRITMRQSDSHDSLGSIYDEHHFGREMFAVSTYVVPLHNAICTVHVAVMVVYPDPTSKAATDKRQGIITIDDSKSVASTSIPGAEWSSMLTKANGANIREKNAD